MKQISSCAVILIEKSRNTKRVKIVFHSVSYFDDEFLMMSYLKITFKIPIRKMANEIFQYKSLKNTIMPNNFLLNEKIIANSL